MNKELVLRAANRYFSLATKLNEEDDVPLLRAEADRFRLGLFRLVVVGEIKKGKSSFINALLGGDGLLPTASDVATSTVYKILYGHERKLKVFLKADSEGRLPPPLTITEAQLAEYGTEDGNPGNEKNIDFIGIEEPHPMLRQGLVIVDTPGLGGLFRNHADVTWRHVPGADALFFVVDSVEAVMSRHEVEAIRKLRRMTPRIFFVQTKIDLADAVVRESWKNRNLNIIAEGMSVPKEKIVYLPVSSKLKEIADRQHSHTHLERSGFLPVLNFLNHHLLEKKEEQVGGHLAGVLGKKVEVAKSVLDEKLRILNADGADRLKELDREYQDAQVTFEGWRKDKLSVRMQKLQDDFGNMRIKILGELNTRLDPSPDNRLVTDVLKNFRNTGAGPEEIRNRLDEVRNEVADECAGIVFDLLTRYNKNALEAIREVSDDLANSLENELSYTPVAIVGRPENPGDMKTSEGVLEKFRPVYMTGGMGFTIMGTAASILFPPAAAVVAAVLGLVFGGWLGRNEYKEKQAEALLARLQSALLIIVKNARGNAAQQFQEISSAVQQKTRDQLLASAKKASEQFEARRKEISVTMAKSKEELRSESASLKELLTESEQILSDLKRALV